MKPLWLAVIALSFGWRQGQPPPPGLAAGLPLPPVIKLGGLSRRQIAEATADPRREAAGIHRGLPSSALKKGKWIRLADGRRLWRLAIRADGARGVRVHFRQFAVDTGLVWLYGTGKQPEVNGPFTATGPYKDGDFWSGIVDGDSVVLEYQPAPGSFPKTPPFRIPEISHLFR